MRIENSTDVENLLVHYYFDGRRPREEKFVRGLEEKFIEELQMYFGLVDDFALTGYLWSRIIIGDLSAQGQQTSYTFLKNWFEDYLETNRKTIANQIKKARKALKKSELDRGAFLDVLEIRIALLFTYLVSSLIPEERGNATHNRSRERAIQAIRETGLRFENLDNAVQRSADAKLQVAHGKVMAKKLDGKRTQLAARRAQTGEDAQMVRVNHLLDDSEYSAFKNPRAKHLAQFLSLIYGVMVKPANIAGLFDQENNRFPSNEDHSAAVDLQITGSYGTVPTHRNVRAVNKIRERSTSTLLRNALKALDQVKDERRLDQKQINYFADLSVRFAYLTRIENFDRETISAAYIAVVEKHPEFEANPQDLQRMIRTKSGVVVVGLDQDQRPEGSGRRGDERAPMLGRSAIYADDDVASSSSGGEKCCPRWGCTIQ